MAPPSLNLTVKVHPVVYMAIVDAYERKSSSNIGKTVSTTAISVQRHERVESRALGTLLGFYEKNVVQVFLSFYLFDLLRQQIAMLFHFLMLVQIHLKLMIILTVQCGKCINVLHLQNKSLDGFLLFQVCLIHVFIIILIIVRLIFCN
jgi:hypothetical protein